MAGLTVIHRKKGELKEMKGGGKVTVLPVLAGREVVKDMSKMCLLDHFPLL